MKGWGWDVGRCWSGEGRERNDKKQEKKDL
jgi:hypothetical protein